jgi:hypothetical protein
MHGDNLLRQAQGVLGEAVLDADDPLTRSAIRQGYHLIRAVLEDRNPDAPCEHTDPWSAETFNDLWKDDNGVRPHGFTWTGRNVRDWIALRDIKKWLNE